MQSILPTRVYSAKETGDAMIHRDVVLIHVWGSKDVISRVSNFLRH